MGQLADTPPAVESVERAPGRRGEPDLPSTGVGEEQTLVGQGVQGILGEPAVLSDSEQLALSALKRRERNPRGKQ